jgi:hypothetical protein
VDFNSKQEANDVFAKLKESGLTINGSKVSFMMAFKEGYESEDRRLRSVHLGNVMIETKKW